MMLSEITPPAIEKWKQKRREGKTMYKRQRNPATVNRELCVLSKILSLAFDAELIESNPCRRVRKFRTNSARTRYLIFDEEVKLFEKLQGQEWVQRIVTMAINTGMRQGEIFGLTWFDVDLPRGGDSHSSLEERQGSFRSDKSNGPHNVGRTATYQRACLSESKDERTFGRREA
jgi:integrase